MQVNCKNNGKYQSEQSCQNKARCDSREKYNDKQEYIKVLLEQIRCKKVHPFIEKEMREHMEEQIEENLSCGMTEAEAEQAAVEDMGSPVEAGIALDRIHRPKMEWSMVVLMVVIALLGSFIHYGITNELLLKPELAEKFTAVINGSSNFVIYTVIGFAIMILICHIDYSTIGKYAKVLAAAFLGWLFFATLFGQTVNGRIIWLAGFGNRHISLFSFVMLYVPLYGAVIYKYFGMGYKGLFKAVVWMFLPVILVLRLKYTFLAGMLMVILGVILSLAIWLNWFQISCKKVLAALWGVILGLPAVGVILSYQMGWLPMYQIDRIQSFLTNSGGANYLTNRMREFLSDSLMLGNSSIEIIGWLPNFNTSWILVYLSSTYGILIGIVICCVLAILIIKVFSISYKQKNQLGMVMGCGCGIVFLVNTVLNVLENIGFLPATQTFLPFVSAGGSDLVVCYILMGIVLSVYRYKSIYPRHMSTKGKTLKFEISL